MAWEGFQLRESGRGSARRRKSAYALIFAVALLVVMALIGVAFLATTRTDCQAAGQHHANTQVDLLLDGVITLVDAALVDDLFDGSSNPESYRRLGATYRHADAATSDAFLAERVPDYVGTTYRWPAISGPIMGDAFVSPDGAGRVVGRFAAAPTSLTIGGSAHPALDFGAGGVIRAADTDGDGIADAAYWPVPIGTIDGLRWYAAVRVIDNNSALNLAIASRSPTIDESPTFPTQIDVESLLLGTPTQRASQIDALHLWRAGGAPVSLAVVSDAGSARDDLVFATEAEALWMQLGRRLERPGFNELGQRYRAIPLGDAMGLAYPFAVRSRGLVPAVAESLLKPSLVDGARSGPFGPGESSTPDGWGNTQFGYQRESGAATSYALRALVTARNPLSNAVAHVEPRPPVPEGMAPDMPVSLKTSFNTADFAQLWRAFRDVMCEAGGATPFDDAGAGLFNPYDVTHPQRMFRSSLRDVRYTDGAYDDGTVHFAPEQQLLLRAALAAVNAIDLRDSDADVTSRHIKLQALVDGTSHDVEVTVFGTEAQPYVTEVYADTDTDGLGFDGPNPMGYVAVELHNPYPYDLPLTNYHFGVVDRSPQPRGGGQSLRVRPLPGFSGFDGATAPVPVIPANGYLLLENYLEAGARTSDDAMAARFRPNSTGLSTYGNPGFAFSDGTRSNYAYVRGLHEVLQTYNVDGTRSGGGELVLLRPRRADGVATIDEQERVSVGGSWNLHELVPVDQHDFTGIGLPLRSVDPAGNPSAVGESKIYHYARTNGGPFDVPNAAAWRFVYPGRYDGTRSSLRHEGATLARQPGTMPQPGESEPPFVQKRLGDRNPVGSYAHPFPAIQLNNTDWGGPNRTRDAATGSPLLEPHQFPYGSFARAGDVLQVPYIGAYRVRLSDPTVTPDVFIEMNAVTTDCAFADDSDPATDTAESIGRFCPVRITVGSVQVDDYDADGSYAPTTADQKRWRYRWALDVIDHFCTITNPGDDYLPNVDPAAGVFPGLAPEPVTNDYAAAANAGADTLAPVEGLVNVNTAPWPVLAALHLVPGGTPAQQETLARAIVQHRNEHGPFQSLMELNAVQGSGADETFATGWGKVDPTTDYTDAAGDFSPAGAGGDGIVGDFEQQFLMITRASNVLSTRSDSFTCYLLLEGWPEPAASSAEPLVRRRAVVIFDRSRVGPDRNGMRRLLVPAN